MLYFAYGSNMCGTRLAERLAREGHGYSSRRHAIAQGYRLVFDKRSSVEAWVGYANIRPHSGAQVEGTLNELSQAALELLDRIELVPVHYRRTMIRVLDGWSGNLVEAHVYLAQPDVIDPHVRPTRDYVDRLLAASDLLSPDYLRTLQTVECCS